MSAALVGLTGAGPAGAAPKPAGAGTPPAKAPAPDAPAAGDVDGDVVRLSADWFRQEAVVRAFGESGVKLPADAQRRVNQVGTDYQILSETYFITKKTTRAEFLQKAAALLEERRSGLGKLVGADDLARAREAAGGPLYRAWVYGNVLLVAVRTLGGTPEFQQSAGGQAWGPMSEVGQQINGRSAKGAGGRGNREPQPDAEWLKKWEAEVRGNVFDKLPVKSQKQIDILLPMALPEGATGAAAAGGSTGASPAPAGAVGAVGAVGAPATRGTGAAAASGGAAAAAGRGSANGGDWIDVLKALDPAKGASAGSWELAKGVLKGGRGERGTPRSRGGPKLVLPFTVEGGFEWDLTFNRTAGRKEFGLVFPAGDSTAQVWIGGGQGQDSSVEGARGSQVNEARITDGTAQTLHLSVAPDGADVTVSLLLDGKPYLSYAGPQKSLRVRRGYEAPDKHGLAVFVHADSTVEFKDVRLRATTGAVRAARE